MNPHGYAACAAAFLLVLLAACAPAVRADGWGDFFEPGVLFTDSHGTCANPSLSTTPVPVEDGDAPIATSGFNSPFLADNLLRAAEQTMSSATRRRARPRA